MVEYSCHSQTIRVATLLVRSEVAWQYGHAEMAIYVIGKKIGD